MIRASVILFAILALLEKIMMLWIGKSTLWLPWVCVALYGLAWLLFAARRRKVRIPLSPPNQPSATSRTIITENPTMVTMVTRSTFFSFC